MIPLQAVALAVAMMAKPATLRTEGGRYVQGRWEPERVFTAITAVIQAATQRDLLALPEGEREDGMVSIWTRTPIVPLDEAGGSGGHAVVTPEGITYRIVRASLRTEGGFTRAVGRLDDDRGRRVPGAA